MCCKEIFANKIQRHIHHTNSGVQGLVCIHCNHILGQETEEDLQRINDALTYIKSPRENLLGRDDQPERLYRRYASKAQPVVESSETLRCESQMCSQCKRQLMNKSFSVDRTRTRKVCIDCRRSNVRLSQSKQATELRNKTTTCACCGCELVGKKCIHHIQDTIFGVVCNRCNQLLGNETEHHKTRLLACKLWIEDSLVWDYDKGRSGWRHPETDRNDQSCDLVAQ
jgi:hypothetical protein